MMSRIEQLIGEIEEYIDGCKYQPLSNSKIVVNRDELEELLVELRLRIPDEIKQYQKIISNRDAILADAKAKGKSGVCLLGSKKQKHWLTDQSFAKSNGFEVVDTTDDGYELLALSFDGTFPRFTQKAKKQKIENKELTIYYDMQCPFVYQSLEIVKQYCEINNVPILMIQVDTLQKAKDLPCVFNNWAVFYHGEFETVNLLDKNTLTRLLKK